MQTLTQDDVQPPKRSAGSLPTRRVPLPWPDDEPFRILSIDGGGIKGILPSALLAEVEREIMGGESAGRYFDLIAGTSTGGIIALGLSIGLGVAVPTTLSAQCPMCKMSAESNLRAGGTAGKGLNAGILFMLSAPYLLVGGVGLFWYYNRKKNKTAKEEEMQPRSELYNKV